MERQNIDGEMESPERLLARLQPAPPRPGARERILAPALGALRREGPILRRRFAPFGLGSLAAAALALAFLCSWTVEQLCERRIAAVAAATVTARPVTLAPTADVSARFDIDRLIAFQGTLPASVSPSEITAQRNLMKEVLGNGT